MKKFFTYARVSSQEQADRDLSIPAQLRAIRKVASEQRFELAREFIDVESAKEPGRKNFTLMLKELKRRSDVAGVLSHKLDRLLRNLKDYAEVDDLMRDGKEFRFVTESYDDSASGKLALGVRVLFAKHYLDNLSEETKKGLNERVLERGKWSFIAPLGYLNANGEIVQDSERAPLIKKAFELYATGDWSVSELSDYLYAQGLRTRPMRRSESGRFVESRVHGMLRNPFYCGLMRYKGQIIRGVHEPIIEKTVFDQVQAVMNRFEKRSRAVQRWFTYRGLFVCGECGRAITAVLKKGRYTYYHCTKSGGGAQSCSQPFLREEDLTEQLAEQIRPIQLGTEEYTLLRDILKDSTRGRAKVPE
jgi:site-specific DNA recombinase